MGAQGAQFLGCLKFLENLDISGRNTKLLSEKGVTAFLRLRSVSSVSVRSEVGRRGDSGVEIPKFHRIAG